MEDKLAEIRKILEAQQTESEKFIPGKTKIHLSIPQFGVDEIIESIDSFLSTYVTMGKKVKMFENLFSSYIGTRHGIMVNSGSSANLVALSALSNTAVKNHLIPGDEIITPAVTFATTVYPISSQNCVPVFVDVDRETLNMNTEKIEKAVTAKTKAIMLVHLLGNPCDMDEITRIAEENNLLVIEDSCEAHGAEFKGRKVGSFGDVSTFSFFLAHHITTIEGGMILTNNDSVADLSRSIRVFGWTRDMKDHERVASEYEFIDKRYLFLYPGYNMRPTEIQGAFGMHQIKKLDGFVEHRRDNAKYWNNRFRKFSHVISIIEERPHTKISWYGYPITLDASVKFTRKEMTDFLEQRGIETRQIMAGNFVEQPVIRHINHRIGGTLANSQHIMRHSFFWGNHEGIGKEEREFMADSLIEFIEEHD